MRSRRALSAFIPSQTRFQPRPFSTTDHLQQKHESVQTPVQSQNKDSIAPAAARPEAEATILETPLQRQRREALAPQAGQAPRSKSWFLPGLMASMIGVPPLVYYYYQYRREHMDNKRANLVEQQRQKYANGG